jgi:NhaA family Na+:H+ antiporter
MPIFALANAGVALGAVADAARSPLALGVALGLLVGKPVGITLGAWIAVRSGVAVLPYGVDWRRLHGAAWLGGIGFTMSLFVGTLAFGESPLLDVAKAAVLVSSAAAGGVGALLLARRGRA